MEFLTRHRCLDPRLLTIQNGGLVAVLRQFDATR